MPAGVLFLPVFHFLIKELIFLDATLDHGSGSKELEREAIVMRIICHILPLRTLWLLVFSSLMAGCGKEDFILPNSCACGNEAMGTVRELKGTIYHHSELSKYTIVRSIPDMHDAQHIYILCDLPAGYPLDTQRVIFSGRVKQACREPQQVLPGQQYYDIELTKLKKAEE